MGNNRLSYITKMLNENETLKDLTSSLEHAFFELRRCYRNSGKVMICGNGGSAADAEHITGELMKSFLLKRPIPESDAKMIKNKLAGEAGSLCEQLQCGLPTISLSNQMALITAIINDTSADMIFAQQTYVYGRAGDVLVAISTSGNSQNIINAAKVASVTGLKVIGMTGESGGELKNYCDILLNAPSDKCEKIQEYHVKIYHALCADIESEFFGKEDTE